jgi:hypothetical protein
MGAAADPIRYPEPGRCGWLVVAGLVREAAEDAVHVGRVCELPEEQVPRHMWDGHHPKPASRLGPQVDRDDRLSGSVIVTQIDVGSSTIHARPGAVTCRHRVRTGSARNACHIRPGGSKPSRIGHQSDVSRIGDSKDRKVPEPRRNEIMNSFQDPTYDVIVGPAQIVRDDIDAKFERAQQFIDAHWTQFEDPSGVAADLAELRRAVSGDGTGARLANPMRTRLTLHRLNRISGNAAPVAAVLAVVREMLGTAR